MVEEEAADPSGWVGPGCRPAEAAAEAEDQLPVSRLGVFCWEADFFVDGWKVTDFFLRRIGRGVSGSDGDGRGDVGLVVALLGDGPRGPGLLRRDGILVNPTSITSSM